MPMSGELGLRFPIAEKNTMSSQNNDVVIIYKQVIILYSAIGNRSPIMSTPMPSAKHIIKFKFQSSNFKVFKILCPPTKMP